MCKESKETLRKLRKVVPYSTTPIYPWSPKKSFKPETLGDIMYLDK